MNSWLSATEVSKVKPIPDGTGEFSRRLGFLVDKSNIGFGMRSWRYSMIVNDGVIEMMFVEPDVRDSSDNDPFEVSDVYTMLEYLKGDE